MYSSSGKHKTQISHIIPLLGENVVNYTVLSSISLPIDHQQFQTFFMFINLNSIGFLMVTIH